MADQVAGNAGGMRAAGLLPVGYGGADGVRAVRCTLAAIRSAQEGRPTAVAEVDETFTAY